MDIQSEKIKLIEWLARLSDITTLKKLAEIRNLSINNNNEPLLHSLSVEELKTRALESEKTIEQGQLTSFDDLQKEMKAW